jgi:hypothetical protein
MQDIVIELKDLACKIEGKDDRAFYGIFKALADETQITSKKTSSMFGNYDK